MWTIIIVVILIFLVSLESSNNLKKERDKGTAIQNEYIKNQNICITTEYTYNNSKHHNPTRFVIDDVNKSIHVSSNSTHLIEIPYYEILGCEILTDSQVTGGVGRAVVGSMLAGDVGAIVGATTAKPYIMSYKVIIYCENITSPQFIFNLITEKTKTSSFEYTWAVDFASKVNASIKVIISKNQKGENIKPTLPTESYNQPLKKVVLSPDQSNKMIAVKYVKETMGLGLKESLDFVDSNVPVICDNVTIDDAKAKVRELASLGIDARIINSYSHKKEISASEDQPAQLKISKESEPTDFGELS